MLLPALVSAIAAVLRIRLLDGERDSYPIIVRVSLGIAKDTVRFTVSSPSTDWIAKVGVTAKEILPAVMVADTNCT